MGKPYRVIQSIQRAINIMNCFTIENPSLSLTQISEMLDLNINTTRGIVNTLLYNGYIEHDEEENTYTLGLVFIEKSKLVENNNINMLESIFSSKLEYLANKYNVSARLQIISDFTIMTALTYNPKNARYKLIASDFHFPLNATSSGKLFLYHSQDEKQKILLNSISNKKHSKNTIIDRDELMKELNLIGKKGYSTEFEELDIGISSLAVPILDSQDKIIGTISITGLDTIIKTIEEEAIKDIKDIIRNAKIYK